MRTSALATALLLLCACTAPLLISLVNSDSPACAAECGDDCMPGCERCTCAHRPFTGTLDTFGPTALERPVEVLRASHSSAGLPAHERLLYRPPKG